MVLEKKTKLLKIAVAGLTNAGKSTLVKTIAEISHFSTDIISPSENRETTIAIDFGVLRLNEYYAIYLYGLPGQDRFSFMWDVVRRGTEGFIYLTEASQINDEIDLKRYQVISKKFAKPHVVGVTKMDMVDNKETSMEMARFRLRLPLNRILLPCDPRKKDSSKTLLIALLQEIIDSNL